ncbi:MAG: ribonuclease Y [Elusimicrobiota bacterium]
MNSLIVIGAVVVGIILGYIARVLAAKSSLSSAEQQAKTILSNAKRDAEAHKKEMTLEVKDEMYKNRQEFERETKDRRAELQQYEKRLGQREEGINSKQDLLEKKDRELKNAEALLFNKDRLLNEEIENVRKEREEQKNVLQRVANMSPEEAKKILMKNMEDEARHEAMGTFKKIEQELKDNADKKAKEIISLAIQRCAADYTAEITVTAVTIPSDEMKGRIIGREGRNIRAFEVATGVDLVVDDTPEAITISSFDGIRREVARVSLERLIADGRIHPARIEEVVERVKKEMEVYLKDVGEQAALEAGVSGLPQEVIKLLGRLKYRTSYGQNVLQHSLEVAHLAKVMSEELGLDTALCVKAGLLHDIGKSMDHDVEGTHTQIGADILKKHNFHPKLINAVLAHHEGEVKPETPEAVIIAAADAISAARPGARRESLEFYLKRMDKLETIADGFKGVEKAYAIQAGREVRIIVRPDVINDDGALILAKDIAKKIEGEVEYPGQIKVTVIRETRATGVAK